MLSLVNALVHLWWCSPKLVNRNEPCVQLGWTLFLLSVFQAGFIEEVNDYLISIYLPFPRQECCPTAESLVMVQHILNRYCFFWIPHGC